ncbi:MAG: hypothetical protein WC538_03490 [Thermoanaerobaculia bacterium]|jgi:hypothetical protein
MMKLTDQSEVEARLLVNDTAGAPALPAILVLSTTTRDADSLSRCATTIRNQAKNGAMVVSSHWGSPQILVDVPSWTRGPLAGERLLPTKSLQLAASATRLLQAAGLAQSSDRPLQDLSHHGVVPADSMQQPPMIQVSVPANFGVELMLLAGAALRPLTDRHVLFVGLCGRIDSALRARFHADSVEALTAFANQLPKHRIADLFPLFFMVGASFGIARGVLDRLISDNAIQIRSESTVPSRRQVRTRVPRGLETSIPLVADPMM